MTTIAERKAGGLRSALLFDIPVSLGCGIFYAGIISAGIALLDPWLSLGFSFESAPLKWLFLALILPCAVLMYWVIRKTRMTPSM